MLLPAVMIHCAVHTTEAVVHRIFSHAPQQLSSIPKKELLAFKFSYYARNFGPTTIGLVCIPFLPWVGRFLFHVMKQL